MEKFRTLDRKAYQKHGDPRLRLEETNHRLAKHRRVPSIEDQANGTRVLQKEHSVPA